MLAAASRLFRERGFDAVTLDDVTKEAGLTRGAFYGHFKSKDDLLAHAVAHAVEPTEALRTRNFEDYITRYLSARQRDGVAEGCAFAALAAEVARQPAHSREPMTQGFEEIIRRLSEKAPGETPEIKRAKAIATMSGMVGGLILARMSAGTDVSDEILATTRAHLIGNKD